MNDRTDEKNEGRGAESPASYGGYVARQTYERRSRSIWQTPAVAALYLLLFLLSIVGLVTLFRGTLFFNDSNGDQVVSGNVTVPQVNSKEVASPENAVASVEDTLITVELKRADGVVRGTGFLITEDGYAVCHSSLFEAPPTAVTVYTGDGTVAAATEVGSIPSLGVTVIKLENRYAYRSIALGNSIIRRGQTLYGVASVSRGVFYGLTREGIATSTAENVTVTVGEEERSIPILYTSIAYDATLDGALVITGEGNAAGFLTGTLPGRGGMTAVPIITLVGLVNEIINVE